MPTLDIYRFFCGDIRVGKTYLNFFESFLNIILTSAFTSEIDLDFSIYLLSHFFFLLVNLIIPCLCPILNSFFSSTCFIKEMKVYLISSQKVSQNSLFKSSLYGYLLFFILLMDSAISLFQLFLCRKNSFVRQKAFMCQ